jgi:hypothetical protein
MLSFNKLHVSVRAAYPQGYREILWEDSQDYYMPCKWDVKCALFIAHVDKIRMYTRQ